MFNIISNAVDYTNVCTHAIDAIFETDPEEDDSYILPQTWSELTRLLIRNGLVLIHVGEDGEASRRYCFGSFGGGFVHKGACAWDALSFEDEFEEEEI